MPLTALNGVQISYEVTGSGSLVLLIMGNGSPGRVWRTHQAPALVKAGFRVATVDNRGIAPSSESAAGITMPDLVDDTAALIEHLGTPAHVVGTSMGSRVVAELCLTRPELLSKAVMFAATARPHPVAGTLNRGEQALYDKGIELPPEYAAAIKAMLNLSPHTLEDPGTAQEWLDIFEFTSGKGTPGTAPNLAWTAARTAAPPTPRFGCRAWSSDSPMTGWCPRVSVAKSPRRSPPHGTTKSSAAGITDISSAPRK